MAEQNEFGISLDDAINELQGTVEEAANFMFSEFSQDWETGEAYYAGKCDLPTEVGRSTLVKTEARDSIRAIMPNIMRVLLSTTKPVEYIPTSLHSAMFVDQQARWINQEFMRCGGYTAIYNACLESAKLKSGPIKVIWEESPAPEHIHATGLTREAVLAYTENADIVVDTVERQDSPTGGEFYELRATRYYENGRMHFEAFPMYEFFITRNASSMNAVHGHRRSVTVSEAVDLGLEYEDWRSLDDDDPRSNDASGADTMRRGYQVDASDEQETDLMNHTFLLSEVYCQYDLDGDGVAEKYVFFLGGTSYEYLHHEQIEDFCIALVNIDPQPFSPIGRSIVDLTKQSQDNETSILRAIVDNAHIANNPRPAADPSRTNFQDLMNNAIGAPIRTKGDAKIAYTEVPFTAQGLLPFLEWLERDAEIRVGVTKAAQGLDPDALQSTDKDAVLNTISLSQGQIELMVRNIVHTGLIPLFQMALRIAVRHMDSRQMLLYKGDVLPIDIGVFDPNLLAIPKVGIGTADQTRRVQTLQFIYNEQKTYMQQFGMSNPFTSLSKVYNTLEDLCEYGGITNLGRYFSYIDETAEKVIAENFMRAQAEQAQQERELMPLDPGKALFMSEQLKARTKIMELMNERAIETQKLQQRAMEAAEEMDLRRDDLVQGRIIELAKIGQGALNERVKREQDGNSSTSSGTDSEERETSEGSKTAEG